MRFLHVPTLTDSQALLACLSMGFFIRLVPELLAFPHPIGFDTIYYANIMKNSLIISNWTGFFTSTWLLNAFIVPLNSLSHTDPFLILKIVAPLLYGLNVAGIYWFARKNLNWSIYLGIFTGVFFALQLASLRISWDLLRNTLGLGVLLFAFSYANDVKSTRGVALFAALSLLSVFAHEYSAVTLLFVVSSLAIWQFIKGRTDLSKRLILAISPAMIIFSIGIYLRMFPLFSNSVSNIIGAGDSVGAHPSNLFFLVNYLNVKTSVDFYGSYSALALNVVLLFTLLYLPYLYLAMKGLFKNYFLTLWFVLLCVGSFSCLVIPFSALQYWHRWMFMLVYPLTFYAVYGLSKLLSVTHLERRKPRFSWDSNRKAASAVILTFVLGSAYLVTPISMVYANTSVPSASGTYLYFSTNPTVPYQDVDSVVQAMNWLNDNMDENSCVLLQRAYLEWGKLYLDNCPPIIVFQNNVDQAVNKAIDYNYSQIFFVWWNAPIGWYGVSVPSSFVTLQDFGRISVYTYGGKTID
ncbi:MAG: hypothetical protein NWF04_00350 [Candidatus Bathyarchaeota archaeon]|nr:hypothetical protein [Candidatus Bathyarchaeota archaeon]